MTELLKPRRDVRRFDVFAPAILRHFERGDRYEAIRDAVREEWNKAS